MDTELSIICTSTRGWGSRSLSRLLSWSFTTLLASSFVAAHATDTRVSLPPGVAVIVNGEAVPQSVLDGLLTSRLTQTAEAGAPLRSASADEQRQALDDLINMTLLRQRAVARGIDRQAATVAELEVQHKRMLAERLMLDVVRATKVSEDDLRTAYRDMAADSKLTVAHVLVADEAAANAVIAQLKRGVSFATLAKRRSVDAGSAVRGGALGTVKASTLVPEFAQAAAALRPGEFTQQPVQSDFGWHVIRLTAKAPLAKPPFAAVKKELEASLRQSRVEAQLTAVRAQARVKMLSAP